MTDLTPFPSAGFAVDAVGGHRESGSVQQPNTAAPTATVHHAGTPAVSGKTADILGAAFYTAVATIALAGQTQAAVSWLHWPVQAALPAVAVVELGGIALAARADFRRRLGERALAARVLSGAVAVGAVIFNWLGHVSHMQGGFFAGMSALGYAVWLINSADRRRDQLRAAGMLPAAPPAYPPGMWLAHPWVTRRARQLAVADPTLGLYPSWAAARDQVRAERRRGAVARVLRRRVRKATKDRAVAKVAGAVYDMDSVAVRVEAAADYTGLAAIVAADLDPATVLGASRSPRRTPRTVADQTTQGGPGQTVSGQPGGSAGAVVHVLDTHRRTRGAPSLVDRLDAHYPDGPPPSAAQAMRDLDYRGKGAMVDALRELRARRAESSTG